MATVLVVEDIPSLPVVALTALATGDAEWIRAAGCDGYMVKPLACKDSLTTIAEPLARQ